MICTSALSALLYQLSTRGPQVQLQAANRRVPLKQSYQRNLWSSDGLFGRLWHLFWIFCNSRPV